MFYHFLRETIISSKFWNFLRVRIMKGKVPTIKILIVQVHIAKCTVVLVKSVCFTVKEYYHQQIIVLILSLFFFFCVCSISGHPWILFYTECALKAVPNTRLRITNRTLAPRRIEWEKIRAEIDSSSSETSSQKSDEQDECGFVDALAAAISRVRISEPKRTRLCGPTIPVQQECSSNLKANLCTAF